MTIVFWGTITRNHNPEWYYLGTILQLLGVTMVAEHLQCLHVDTCPHSQHFPCPHTTRGVTMSRVTCHVSRCAGSVTANICRGFLTQADTSWHKLTPAQRQQQGNCSNSNSSKPRHNIRYAGGCEYAAYTHPPACSRGTRNRAAAVMFENVGRLDDGDNHRVALHYTEYSRANTRHTATQHSLCLLPAQSSPDWITAMDLIL